MKRYNMKNYFDHEIKVRYIDELLNHSLNWQWLINETENAFDYFGSNVSNYMQFKEVYSNLCQPYKYLAKINSIGSIKLVFKESWMQQLNYIALMYNGKLAFEDIWELLSDDFFRFFSIVSYVTKLFNNNNDTQYIFFDLIFNQNNIFNLYNLSHIQDNCITILKYINKINFTDLPCLIRFFNNNVENITVSANINLIEQYKDNLYNANAFNYQKIEHKESISWEEKYIFDMLLTEIKEKELVPFCIFGGVSTPNILLWTEEILLHLKQYFNNKYTSFIIETVYYILYKRTPSNDTISSHFELLINKLEKLDINSSLYDIKCSSLSVIKYLLIDKQIGKGIKDIYMKILLPVIHKFLNFEVVIEFKKFINISQEQKDLLSNFYKIKLDNIYKIEKIADFNNFCINLNIVEEIKPENIKIIISRFNYFIKIINDSVNISMAFESIMILLIRLNSNKYLDSTLIKRLMIKLISLWEKVYYYKCLSLMQQESKIITFSKEYNQKINDYFINDIINIAFKCMPILKNNILDEMCDISKHAFIAFAKKVYINKIYPSSNEKEFDKENSADLAFSNIIENLINDKGYKMMNCFPVKNYNIGLYEIYKSEIIKYFTIFVEEKLLYQQLRTLLKEYQLIDINNDDIFLAHVTQLFPILEIKIRELGICYNIVPIKESVKDITQLKDPSSILNKIIWDNYEEIKDLDNVIDYFFIYQCMYNKNMLNIRNECIHGRNFIDYDIKFAFKVTLTCLKLVLNRLAKINKLLVE